MIRAHRALIDGSRASRAAPALRTLIRPYNYDLIFYGMQFIIPAQTSSAKAREKKEEPKCTFLSLPIIIGFVRFRRLFVLERTGVRSIAFALSALRCLGDNKNENLIASQAAKQRTAAKENYQMLFNLISLP